jgi:hypothetical protein
LCLICGKQLTNAAMASAKPKWHIITNHSHMTSKSADYFKWLLESQNIRVVLLLVKSVRRIKKQLFSSRTDCLEKERSHSWWEPNNASM